MHTSLSQSVLPVFKLRGAIVLDSFAFTSEIYHAVLRRSWKQNQESTKTERQHTYLHTNHWPKDPSSFDCCSDSDMNHCYCIQMYFFYFVYCFVRCYCKCSSFGLDGWFSEVSFHISEVRRWAVGDILQLQLPSTVSIWNTYWVPCHTT